MNEHGKTYMKYQNFYIARTWFKKITYLTLTLTFLTVAEF